MKIIFTVILKFILSFFITEYQLKDVLKEAIEDMARSHDVSVYVAFKRIRGTKQEYIMTVRFNSEAGLKSYTTAVLNEVSRDRQQLESYIDQFIQIFSANITGAH